MGEKTEKSTSPTRREVMIGAASLAAAATLGSAQTPTAMPNSTTLKGRINHSVCLWCYRGMTSATMAPEAARLGLKGIDLLTPAEWVPLKEHGLICSMTSQASTIQVGLNRKENHPAIIAKLNELIEATSAAGYPNVICFSGNRSAGRGAPPISDEEGLKNCAEGLKQVMSLAEQKKVTVCMELLNSKLNHKDYMCDHTPWGVALCKAVGSERFKLLYDIYHMQIMEGDVIQTLKDNIQYIGHVHTGGVPGRHEIDETQELYYPAIMQALIDLKYTGYVAQEFVPAKQDKIASLAAAVKVCDV
jgi:hydroxypyruvate isomerase